jgi:hypothetical protein
MQAFADAVQLGLDTGNRLYEEVVWLNEVAMATYAEYER